VSESPPCEAETLVPPAGEVDRGVPIIEVEGAAELRRLERLAAIGTMVAGFAHEVRNPVAALRSLAESLDEDLVDLGLRMPQVQRMQDVLDRIERLVRTSLQFGRPDPPRLAAHRPWEIASQALAAMGPRTRALGGSIQVEVEPDLPDVVVDRDQVAQALIVILDNALDATGVPRDVTLRAGRGDDDGDGDEHDALEVVFSVSDAGPGIAPEIMAHIFDPFFTTKAAGLGLGLSIAQQLVSENAGRLEVASARGGPTAFTLVFASRGGELSRRSDRAAPPRPGR
jgi:signal transduction histidine kinase